MNTTLLDFFFKEKKMLFEFAVKVIKIKQQKRLGREGGSFNRGWFVEQKLELSCSFRCGQRNGYIVVLVKSEAGLLNIQVQLK